MVRLLLIACICMCNFSSLAQHNHFVYVQSDNKQPFYVRLKDKLYSSSASGYVILPKLSAGEHLLSFGFPNNEFPNQEISVNISGKDLGYLLKNFPGKGWGLFNIQSMDVLMAKNASKSVSPSTTETRTDAFSTTLADVVNTPSIKEVNKPQPAPETKPVAAVQPTPPVIPVDPKPETAVVPEKISEPAVPAAPAAALSVIKKTGYAQSSSLIAVQYLVTDDFGNDTVDVEIAIMPAVNEPAAVAEPTVVKTETPPVAPVTAKAEEPKFINIDLPNPNTENKQAATQEKQPEGPTPISSAATENPGKLQMINSDCKSMANDNDFLKARKKMTSQKSDDAMVESAKKLFKQKCYSTEQVKNLSVLFLKDEGKYKFYDAVYPFVYDSKAFRQLESTLTEEYYISRFRSMIRN